MYKCPLNERQQERVAIYCRAVNIEQAHSGYSINEQEELGIRWCIDNGYTNWSVYSDLKEVGESEQNLPGLKKLLKDVTSRKVTTIVVLRINRLARSAEDLMKTISKLNKYDVNLISLSENINTSKEKDKKTFSYVERVVNQYDSI